MERSDWVRAVAVVLALARAIAPVVAEYERANACAWTRTVEKASAREEGK